VVQVAERIAFGIDPAGFVEAHVQVFYEGPPDDFAWVVPVPAEPEVFVSDDALFTAMDPFFAPRFDLDRDVRGDCQPFRVGCGGFETSVALAENDGGFIPPVPGVVVTGEGSAGPYDYVVLDGSSGQAVVDYLNAAEFDVVPELAEKLAPYVSPGGRFLAVRLQKDSDTGDIVPLGFRYSGTQASIPLQLTAIASAPDLGVEVTVFGASRAVPTNYLHVELNPARFDWSGLGQNYFDVLARAVDQAGGQAFATEFAGSSAPLEGALWDDAREALVDRLHLAPTLSMWRDTFVEMNLTPDESLVRAFDGFADPEAVLAWAGSDGLSEDVDLEALNLQLHERLFEPRRRAQAMFDLPYATRMSTTVDPAEMTVDPLFALNATMPDVPAIRTATQLVDCRGSKTTGNARRDLLLPDGRVYEGTDSFMGDVGPDALRIEALSANGPPVVMVDNTELALATADAMGDPSGCSNSVVWPGALLSLLALGVVRRRTTIR
jgi:hypothetical protein